MNKGLEKSDKILWIICTPCLLALVFVIFAFKNGSLAKEISTFYGVLAIMPVFLSLFIYSLVTGKAPTKGIKVEKEQMPILYFAATSFWGLMTFITIIYLLKRF